MVCLRQGQSSSLGCMSSVLMVQKSMDACCRSRQPGIQLGQKGCLSMIEV